jgi:hypothetical protein
MAGAIVNPRVLNVAKPNARLRARQRIIRGRMGNITPPPAIARPAPAEAPEIAEPEVESEEAPALEPLPAAPDSSSEPEPTTELSPEPEAATPDTAR